MANEIQLNATFNIRSNTQAVNSSDTALLSFASTSSYYSAHPQVITSGSYVSLNTGSAANVRYLMISNNPYNGTGSAVAIAKGNTVTSSFCVLQPNDFCVLPGIGSLSGSFNGYYVSALNNTASLQITITEN